MSAVIVEITNTQLRFLENDFPIFAGKTKKAPSNITQKIFTEKAIKSAKYKRYPNS
jgi:hypothetical protein